MNREGFFATVAAAFGAGLGSAATAGADGNGVQIQCPPGEHGDLPAYRNDPAFQDIMTNLASVVVRLDEVEETLATLNESIYGLGNYAGSLTGRINTLIEDNDEVNQNASATNRTQVVASGGNAVAPGQSIGQCQDGS